MSDRRQLTFGSLFAGIGGFDLGFERAGMHCEWQVEIDEYCRRVLAKHWPNVRRWDDVRTFPPADGKSWAVDVICGGPPCQRTSVAAAIQGVRTGETLWPQMLEVIEAIEPRFVVVEQPGGNKNWEAAVASVSPDTELHLALVVQQDRHRTDPVDPDFPHQIWALITMTHLESAN